MGSVIFLHGVCDPLSEANFTRLEQSDRDTAKIFFEPGIDAIPEDKRHSVVKKAQQLAAERLGWPTHRQRTDLCYGMVIITIT